MDQLLDTFAGTGEAPLCEAVTIVAQAMPRSNADFLAAVFPDLQEQEHFAAVYVIGAVRKGSAWKQADIADDVDADTEGRNWYFTLSTYLPQDGEYRRRKSHFHRAYGVMLDDIGSKVDADRLYDFPPSYIIQTSDGNYQAGYLFDEPCTDLPRVEALQDALVEAGLCDAGAKGPSARLGRLPFGINGKYDPWHACRLVEFRVDRRYSIDEIIEGLELVPPAPTAKRKRKATGERLAALIDKNAADVHIPRADENPVLAALKERGLYKRLLSPGKHDITCPWVHEHTDAIDHGTAYFEPTPLYPIGGFKCQHSHGANKHMGALLEYLSVTPAQAKHKDTIRVTAGDLHRVVDAAERVLAASGKYYQRGGCISQIVTMPESGDTRIGIMNSNALLRALSEGANWERFDGRSDDFVVCDPPTRHVGVLFDSEVFNHLPPLQGVARQPYLRPDGAVVSAAGYDAASQMYGVFDERAFTIPVAPSREDAEHALAELSGLLSEFGFANEEARSAALSGMLTAACRSSLSVAPLFHARAPQISSGKSYLLSIIAALSGPGKVTARAYPPSDEECSKLLLATLLDSPAAVMFDNLTNDLYPYESMCSALTSEYLTDRILGGSKTATVNTRTLMLSCGNNVGPVGDMTRRTVTIALDPKCETPAARTFAADPLTVVMENREKYVSHALTIIRAYLCAGAPAVQTADGAPLRTLASYGAWSRWARAPLVWLGLPDPAASVFERMDDDPDKGMLCRLMHAWRDLFGAKDVAVRDIVNSAESISGNSNLEDVVREIAEDRGQVNRRRLGRWVARHEDRIADGMRIVRGRAAGGSERWRLEVLEAPPPVSTAEAYLAASAGF